ncbi:kap104 [Candida pseudojiufengensis]|uniref:kap104 n=1 Tax=Candida pseudojiufengensis TaxID=497109 RepID=UPI0022246C8F|nr:kap104 [Candida pseudojiufengensis]KAI5963283.1 kap104 [Candida pseudojiufengensis]
MSWTPDQNALEQLKHIFKGTLSSNNQERKLANDALIQAKENSEIENYLLTLLIIDDHTTGSDVRAAAGINLKNHILKNKYDTATTIDRSFLLNNIMKGLNSNDLLVRNITGNVITTLFSIYGLDKWSSSLSQLIQLANSPTSASSNDYTTQESAMSALSKICEDSYLQLDQEINGERPLNYLIPELLKILDLPLSNSTFKIKSFVIHCINQFILLNTQSFLIIIDLYLEKIFQLAQLIDNINNKDNLKDLNLLKKNIIISFLSILETRPDKLVPHIEGILNYCLHILNSTNSSQELSLESCEFLFSLSNSADFKFLFTIDKLKIILPILLDKMIYSEDDLLNIEIEDEKDDTNIEDKDDDIKPNFIKSKDARAVSNGNNKNGTSNGNINDNDKNDDDQEDNEEDDEDDDDDEDEDGTDTYWSLRKCSAATLDILSENLPQEVLVLALPILQNKITSSEWPVREAAILAFGAMSSSFISLAKDKLPELVPFLVDLLKDPNPRVRQITCWTLSRYVIWINEEAYEGGNYSNYFQPTFQSIMNCTLDSKKIVQEAACSALSSFIEESDLNLIEKNLNNLLNLFTECFKIYQKKNLIILYDCIQTFVEKMGYENLSADPNYVQILLPPLLNKWNSLNDEDNALWPLLECMASIAATLKDLFAPYAIPIYERSLTILSNCIIMDQNCSIDPNINSPEKDFIVTSIDLIDGLIQGFEYHSIDLINYNGDSKNSSNLVDLLLVCFEDYNQDVRQSAYALLGDLAIYVINILKPQLHSIFLSIGNEINNRSLETYPVYNNAIWSLGEIIIRLSHTEIENYLENFLNLLIPLINDSSLQTTVLENCSICLGRMGENGSQILAPRLIEFIQPWCKYTLNLIDNEEKQTSVLGMIKIISLNPNEGFGGLSTQQGKINLAKFLEVLGSYIDASSFLQNEFYKLILNFKQLLGDEIWENQILKFVNPKIRPNISI